MESLALDGYEIIEKLAEGGMGVVVKARQVSLDRIVAIKTLSQRYTEDKEYVERFRQEARAAAKLKYHGIVQVYEAGEKNGHYYFVMEFVDGYSIGDWLDSKEKMQEENALQVAKAVAMALDYAWQEAKLIHRDVKPDNILIDKDGTVKILDLGLAKYVGHMRRSTAITSPGLAMGTPNYCSPDQISAMEDIDFRADIYSLGAVLYHMVTGVMPFEEGKGFEAMIKHVTEYLDDPQRVNPKISTPCAWLIEKMMMKRREDRHQSWSNVIEDIVLVQRKRTPASPFPKKGGSTVKRREARDAERRASEAKEKPIVIPRKSKSAASRSRSVLMTKKKSKAPLVVNFLLLLLIGVIVYFLWAHEAIKDDITEKKIDFLQKANQEENNQTAVISEKSRSDKRILPERRAVLAVPLSKVTAEQPEKNYGGSNKKDDPLNIIENDLVTLSIGDKERLRYEKVRSDYNKTIKEILAANRSWKFDRSIELLDAWKNSSEIEEFDKKIAVNKRRIKLMRRLFASLDSKSEKIKGVIVYPRKNIQGKILNIKDGELAVLCQMGGTGEAQLKVNIFDLDLADIINIHKAAYPERKLENSVAILLSQGKYDVASLSLVLVKEGGKDVVDLHAWLSEWREIENIDLQKNDDNKREQFAEDQMNNIEFRAALRLPREVRPSPLLVTAQKLSTEVQSRKEELVATEKISLNVEVKNTKANEYKEIIIYYFIFSSDPDNGNIECVATGQKDIPSIVGEETQQFITKTVRFIYTTQDSYKAGSRFYGYALLVTKKSGARERVINEIYKPDNIKEYLSTVDLSLQNNI